MNTRTPELQVTRHTASSLIWLAVCAGFEVFVLRLVLTAQGDHGPRLVLPLIALVSWPSIYFGWLFIQNVSVRIDASGVWSISLRGWSGVRWDEVSCCIVKRHCVEVRGERRVVWLHFSVFEQGEILRVLESRAPHAAHVPLRGLARPEKSIPEA